LEMRYHSIAEAYLKLPVLLRLAGLKLRSSWVLRLSRCVHTWLCLVTIGQWILPCVVLNIFVFLYRILGCSWITLEHFDFLVLLLIFVRLYWSYSQSMIKYFLSTEVKPLYVLNLVPYWPFWEGTGISLFCMSIWQHCIESFQVVVLILISFLTLMCWSIFNCIFEGHPLETSLQFSLFIC
jgi:hypothetical protein